MASRGGTVRVWDLRFYRDFHYKELAASRGVLDSVSVNFYGYGQPKPNILVCEILNQNRPKWLEINRFQCISILVGFGRFSVFQREGY